MCNLCAMTSTQQAIREFTRATRDTAGNLAPLPGIFPDGMAPVVFNCDSGEREITMMRWGMPCYKQRRQSVPLNRLICVLYGGAKVYRSC
jgi:putative SOS response-associated peptidase YedK